MKKKYPASSIKLIKGGGGIFDVICDGTLIYSKLNMKGQRFPHDGEISQLIESAIS
ncbi:MAG: Rdx family protein [Syntrophales bacterium LBB04]|nr:Rdx family protein [Syntrophales bacterium LBB04]